MSGWEMRCVRCDKHLGWTFGSAPNGIAYCDECYARVEAEQEADHADA